MGCEVGARSRTESRDLLYMMAISGSSVEEGKRRDVKWNKDNKLKNSI